MYGNDPSCREKCVEDEIEMMYTNNTFKLHILKLNYINAGV